MKRGFTLIELLVVISIVSLISSIVVTTLNSARDKARIASGRQFEANMHHAFGSNVLGIWSFNENGGTGVSDLSGNGFNGTLVGGPAWVGGAVPGSALRFNGTNHVSLTNISGRTDLVGGANGKILFMAWIYPTSYAAGEYRVFAAGFPGFLYFAVNPSQRLQLMVNNGGVNYWPESIGTIPLNKWSHVAFLLEGGIGYKMYIDGKLDRSESVPTLQVINMGSGFTGIGRSWDGVQWFVGDIDDVRAYHASF